MFCCSCRTKTVTLKQRLSRACTCVSLECGDETAKVLLQLQNGHLTRLVSYKSVSGLHVESGRRVKSKKTNAGIHFHHYRQQGPTKIPPQKEEKQPCFACKRSAAHETFGGSGCKHVYGCWQDSVSVCDLECFNGHWPDLLQSFKSKSRSVLEITVWYSHGCFFF